MHLTALSLDKNAFPQELIQHRCSHVDILWHLVEAAVTVCGPTSPRDCLILSWSNPVRNCCSVVKHLFCYWRHYEIFVSGEYERGHNFCSKALPDGLVLYVCLDSLYVYFE